MQRGSGADARRDAADVGVALCVKISYKTCFHTIRRAKCARGISGVPLCLNSLWEPYVLYNPAREAHQVLKVICTQIMIEARIGMYSSLPKG